MNLSYRELSIWIHIVILGIIYGVYFSLFATSAFTGNLVGGQWVGLLILATLAITFAEAISQTILALFNLKSANQPSDERDQQLESTATRISHYVLVVGLWFGFSSIFVSSSPVFMFNVIFFFFVLGELAGYIYQVVSYRRAA
jgi:hypothetical protein